MYLIYDVCYTARHACRPVCRCTTCDVRTSITVGGVAEAPAGAVGIGVYRENVLERHELDEYQHVGRDGRNDLCRHDGQEWH